jgi:hypothetical protein
VPAALIAATERAVVERRLPTSARKPVEQAIAYFRRNESFMDYPLFLAAGLPIATGVIEGTCRHLVQDRMGITGARWDLPGAEAILKLRALHSSGDWDDYWRFHERQEALRNYAAAAQCRRKRRRTRSRCTGWQVDAVQVPPGTVAARAAVLRIRSCLRHGLLPTPPVDEVAPPPLPAPSVAVAQP